jgi:hypothetical protein
LVQARRFGGIGQQEAHASGISGGVEYDAARLDDTLAAVVLCLRAGAALAQRFRRSRVVSPGLIQSEFLKPAHQCLDPSLSKATVITPETSGGLSSTGWLHHSHGAPAPHSQPFGISDGFAQGRSGWFSQTQPVPAQILQSEKRSIISHPRNVAD